MTFPLHRSKFSRALLITAGVWSVPHSALALCTASNSNVIFSPAPTQRDSPVGTVIATASVITAITCHTAHERGEWRIGLSYSNTDYGSTSLANVRQTNKPGVGIRWQNTNSETGRTQFMSAGALNDTNLYRGLPMYARATFTDKFELVKVGAITSESLPAWSLSYDYRNQAGTSFGRLIQFNLEDTVITQTACTVTNSSVNVPMNSFSRSVFTGVGSTSPIKNFSVSLNCDAQVNPNITINATPDKSGATGVMALDSGAATAVGIGIQILRNNTPITLGSLSSTSATSASGPYNINLQARYYQTMTAIKAGEANGTATFTMTYN